MKNWTEILKRKINAGCSYSVIDLGRAYWKKEMEKCWQTWQDAVNDGWDSTNMAHGRSEIDRFNNYVNGILNDGL